MVSIITKKIKGNEYLYLVHSIRKGKKVVQKTIKYIGRKRFISKVEFESMIRSFEEKDWILNEMKDELSYQKHQELNQAQKEYKKYLRTLDKISKKKEREHFLSNFIANSNAIEGSTLTEHDTFNLLFMDNVPKNSTTKEIHMALNMIKAWEYVEINHKRFPTDKDLFILHKFVNNEIEEDKTLGKYKKIQNYVGEIHTTSCLYVKERMLELFNWIKKAYENVNDFEVAFQSHAQFELIHPFIDGNGRVGRLLLNWLLMYKNKLPLAIQNKKRNKYLSALSNAQRGNIESISKFCYEEYIRQYKGL